MKYYSADNLCNPFTDILPVSIQLKSKKQPDLNLTKTTMNPKDSLKFSILRWCTVISLFTDFIPVSGLNSTNSSQSAIVPLLRATSSPRQANSSEGPNFELELLDSIFSSQKSNVTKSTSYGSVLLPKGYNRLAIPLSSEGKPVYTYVSLFLRTVLEVDETNEVNY
jgi:hypothetical protein